MAVFRRGGVWWYKFYFADQFIRESSKSRSKTVAKDTENQRRRELEQGYHNLRQKREHCIRLLRDVADDYAASSACCSSWLILRRMSTAKLLQFRLKQILALLEKHLFAIPYQGLLP